MDTSDDDAALYAREYQLAKEQGRAADVYAILSIVNERISAYEAVLKGKATLPLRGVVTTGPTPAERARVQIEALIRLRAQIENDIKTRRPD